MSEAAVQIPKSVGTYTEDSGHSGSAYVFSRFPEGDLLLMRVLIVRKAALITWQ